MRELIEKRTATAKHFDLGNGICRLEAHIGQIHFRDGALKDGTLCDIDTTLEYNVSSKLFAMMKASYEAQIGLYGDVRFFNVDHSFEFRLPNPKKIEAKPYDGSEFGRLQKALIWRDILQPGGHQIVEVRNNSLAKIFRFERKPASNIIEFQVSGSKGLKFSDGTSDFNLTKEASRSIRGGQGLFHSNGRLSWIRQPRAWNHRGEIVDVELQFYRRGNQVWLRKVIPQEFIDRTFNSEPAAWLECDTTTSYYTGAGDGSYYRTAVNETWSAIRSSVGNGSSLTNPYGTAAKLTASSTTNQWYALNRIVYPIDTSEIPDNDTIQSATLKLYGYSKENNLAAPSLAIDHYSIAGYALSNYDGVRQAIADITYADFVLEAYNSFALNATGIGNISKTGITQLASRSTWDVDDSPPPWVNSANAEFRIYFSEQTGTNKDPYLSVTYEVSFLFWNRDRISKPHYRM